MAAAKKKPPVVKLTNPTFLVKKTPAPTNTAAGRKRGKGGKY